MARKTRFKQLIPGNPGTSFVVCLLYALSKKYGIEISNKEQFPVFAEGITHCHNVFHSGILNTIASKYKHRITAFTNNKIVLNFANREINKDLVKFKLNKLDYDCITKLLNRFEFITLAVDIYYFYPYYHDYHFCCLEKIANGYTLFEPKRSIQKNINQDDLKTLINSVKQNLKDAILVFCV